MNSRTQTQIKNVSNLPPTRAHIKTGRLQRECAWGNHTIGRGECAACRKKREGMLQRASLSPRGRGIEGEREVPPIVHELLRSPGQPLDPANRAFFEPRFGYDFTQVRVHTDAKAAESARAVNALAYTVGRDVAFGANQYAPHSREGQKLIAHELTHVVQQENSPGRMATSSLSIGRGSDPSEREAEQNAGSILSNSSISAPSTPKESGRILQRQGSGASPASCRLQICWVPIKAYNLAKAAQVHGVINFDSGAGPKHIEVDPSKHMPVGIWHSHVVNNAGWKSSANCQPLSATCAEVSKIESAAKEYESKDVIYDPLTVTGPNSNSFTEWTLDKAGVSTSLVNVPFGATGWSYFQNNPPQRIDPPHVARVLPSTTPAKSATGAACSTAYKQATTAAAYITLIRDAEYKLTAAGINNIKDQIKILRGLYYGTPWSRDFAKEQSLSRVAGFQTYTASGIRYPRDPVSILDCGLYAAIQQSQDITAHGVSVDVGHLLIGLDAREVTAGGIPMPRLPFPGFGGSGLEIVTWLGDLGGGAGSLARDRVLRSPTQPAATKFTGVDYGGSSNLEGDVAACVVARGGATSVVAPVIPPGKGIADVIEAYLSPATPGGSTDWRSRAKTFLTMYGGTFNSTGDLTNASTLIDTFADKIESFACAYITQRYLGKISDADFLATADNIRPCSREVAETFVHALKDAMKSGGRIEAKRFPTPLSLSPGACLAVTVSIRAKQKAQPLLKQAEQFWKTVL